MITGAVTSDLEAVVRLMVRGPTGIERRVNAVVDTGYDGSMSLPPDLIRALRLPFRRRGRAFLADGSECLFDIFEGTVIGDRRHRRIPIDEADTAPLIGMAMLAGYELRAQVRDHGLVTIQALR